MGTRERSVLQLTQLLAGVMGSMVRLSTVNEKRDSRKSLEGEIKSSLLAPWSWAVTAHISGYSEEESREVERRVGFESCSTQ